MAAFLSGRAGFEPPQLSRRFECLLLAVDSTGRSSFPGEPAHAPAVDLAGQVVDAGLNMCQ